MHSFLPHASLFLCISWSKCMFYLIICLLTKGVFSVMSMVPGILYLVYGWTVRESPVSWIDQSTDISSSPAHSPFFLLLLFLLPILPFQTSPNHNLIKITFATASAPMFNTNQLLCGDWISLISVFIVASSTRAYWI